MSICDSEWKHADVCCGPEKDCPDCIQCASCAGALASDQNSVARARTDTLHTACCQSPAAVSEVEVTETVTDEDGTMTTSVWYEVQVTTNHTCACHRHPA